jgi:phospholipase C
MNMEAIVMELRGSFCRLVVILAAAGILSACGGTMSPAAPSAPQAYGAAGSRGESAGKIGHIVYVVQEGRSFDDLFQGYPGADTASSGKDSWNGIYTSDGNPSAGLITAQRNRRA